MNGLDKFSFSRPCFARMGHPSTGAQDDTGWVGFVLFPLAAQGCAPGQGWAPGDLRRVAVEKR